MNTINLRNNNGAPTMVIFNNINGTTVNTEIFPIECSSFIFYFEIIDPTQPILISNLKFEFEPPAQTQMQFIDATSHFNSGGVLPMAFADGNVSTSVGILHTFSVDERAKFTGDSLCMTLLRVLPVVSWIQTVSFQTTNVKTVFISTSNSGLYPVQITPLDTINSIQTFKCSNAGTDCIITMKFVPIITTSPMAISNLSYTVIPCIHIPPKSSFTWNGTVIPPYMLYPLLVIFILCALSLVLVIANVIYNLVNKNKKQSSSDDSKIKSFMKLSV
jgi:hypothetical protein